MPTAVFGGQTRTSTHGLAAGLLAAIAVLMAVEHAPARCSEGRGTYLPGLQDIEAGVMPPPGLYFKQFTVSYCASARTFTEEGKTDRQVHADALLTAPTFVHVTKTRLYGSNWGWAFFIPMLDVALDGTVVRPSGPTTFHTRRSSLASPMVSPVILGWQHGRCHQRVMLLIYTPAGSYDKRRLVDTGHNIWAAEFDYGYTFRDPETRREISLAPGYTFNTENPETHYLSGQELHVDFAAVQRFPSRLGVGLAGYAWWQTTPDSGSGAELGAFKGRTFALGPLATYVIESGDISVTLTAKYYTEFGVQNRFSGNALWFNVNAEL